MKKLLITSFIFYSLIEKLKKTVDITEKKNDRINCRNLSVLGNKEQKLRKLHKNLEKNCG
jgi:hypothetical protein